MSFKICVVGCRDIAVNGHGPSYKRYAMLHSEVELAACCDIDESKAALLFCQAFMDGLSIGNEVIKQNGRISH